MEFSVQTENAIVPAAEPFHLQTLPPGRRKSVASELPCLISGGRCRRRVPCKKSNEALKKPESADVRDFSSAGSFKSVGIPDVFHTFEAEQMEKKIIFSPADDLFRGS